MDEQYEQVAWEIYEYRIYGAPQETFRRVLWIDKYLLEDGSTPELDSMLERAEKHGFDAGAKTIHIRPLYVKKT